MNDDTNKHDHGSALAEAELKMERHLDMLQSNDGMIDQLRRNTDFAQTLMELVAWAVDTKDSPRRKNTVLTLADSLHFWARRGV